MRLTILGGGGFRVPLVYGALLGDHAEGRVTEVTLHDLDAGRLGRHRAGPRRPGAQRRARTPRGSPSPPTSTRPCAAPTSSSPRSGSAASRAARPTSGSPWPRACWVRRRSARAASRTDCAPSRSPSRSRAGSPALAPDAWVINFTNPAGLVTEAMAAAPRRPRHRHLRLAGGPRPPRRPRCWAPTRTSALDRLRRPQPPRLAARPARRRPRRTAPAARRPRALGSFEEGKLFGADWLRSLGAIPNEYLHYYYFNREAVRAYQEAKQTRGAFLHEQQARLLRGDGAARRPGAGDLGPDPRRARGHLHGGEPRGGRRRRARRRATWSPAATRRSPSP